MALGLFALIVICSIYRATQNNELVKAVESNNLRDVQTAISYGADPNARKTGNSNPTDIPSIVEQFMRRLSKPQNDEPVIILSTDQHYNPDYGGDSLLPEKDREIVRLLLSHGANPNVLSTSGRTPLILVTMNADIETLKLILNYTIDIDQKDRDSRTALMWAVLYREKEVVNLLLSRGASVDAATDDGTTALMMATRRNRVDIVRILLAHGADPNKKDNSGETAVSVAATFHHKQILALLHRKDK